MPYAAGRNCTKAGCGGVIRNGVCSECGVKRSSNWEKQRKQKSASQRGYGATWRRLRAMVLADSPFCAECLREGKYRSATVVDHIKPKAWGGDDSFENLQPLCTAHHKQKTQMESNQERQPRPERYPIKPSTIPVVIVAGPPGSGKTTYVRNHMRHGDLIVDIDALYVALSGLGWHDKPLGLLPFVCEARDAVIARLARKSDVARCWIITGTADTDKLQELKAGVGAERLIVLTTSRTDCIKNIMNDATRSHMAALQTELVDRWFREFDKRKLGDVAERAPG